MPTWRQVLDFPWAWEGDTHMAEALARVCAVGFDGQLALVGPSWEVARISIARGHPAPAGIVYLTFNSTFSSLYSYKLYIAFAMDQTSHMLSCHEGSDVSIISVSSPCQTVQVSA